MTYRFRSLLGLSLGPLLPLAAETFSTNAAAPARHVIVAEKMPAGAVTDRLLPDVEDVRVFTAKKAESIDLDALPRIQTDNWRQAFSKTPGLLSSETVNGSVLSIGSRGIGDPHETQNLLVLKDGIPFVVDLYGYPTVYSAPSFESLERMEFVRGGASLLYGPQPAGALSYVTRQPHTDRPLSIRTQHLFGSYDLYTTYSQLDGTEGRLGYLVSFDHRQGNGFRKANSDFMLDGGSVRLVLDGNTDRRWILNLDGTHADSGEPGGLSLRRGAGLLNYSDDRTQTLKLHDRIRTTRVAPSLSMERDFDDSTRWTVRTWGSSYERVSRRQIGDGFGSAAGLRNAANIDAHQYWTAGADSRLRKDYELGGITQTWTGGFSTYWSDTPVRRELGSTATADTGALVRASQRDTLAGSIFTENVFRIGRLSLVPGVRLETIRQSIRESFNVARPTALLSDEDVSVVPLAGLGVAWRWDSGIEAYGNSSQGYKAKTYGDSLPVDSNNASASTTLDPGHTWTHEIGIRGQPKDWVSFDASVFMIDYDNRFGRVNQSDGTVRIENVGRSINRGVDLAGEINLTGAADAARGTDWAKEWGAISLYANAELLHAEFVSGPLDGKTPQYAPGHLVRTGVTYRLGKRARVGLLGTMTASHFANDSNDADWRIPAYRVWDLTAEVTVWRDLRVFAGLNNLFDAEYYSRIRSNGIDPAVGRNFFAGASLAF